MSKHVYVGSLPPNEPGDPWLCGIYVDGKLVAVGQGADREAAEADAQRKWQNAQD